MDETMRACIIAALLELTQAPHPPNLAVERHGVVVLADQHGSDHPAVVPHFHLEHLESTTTATGDV